MIHPGQRYTYADVDHGAKLVAWIIRMGVDPGKTHWARRRCHLAGANYLNRLSPIWAMGPGAFAAGERGRRARDHHAPGAGDSPDHDDARSGDGRIGQVTRSSRGDQSHLVLVFIAVGGTSSTPLIILPF